ncbi:RNA-binding cell elongation regulator Jag/EloR [Paenibacillus wenxiniae]|uniref:RNA-binding protein KhpB n=1 Tax=Paenibacillus wenxiniae TaxID=1636843 RepID=A0ABW4RFE2_9BACL
MTTVIASGKTIDDAISEGLARLNTTKEYVDVTILQAPSKGFLGLIGAKQAQVKLTLLESEVSIPSSTPKPAATMPQREQRSTESATTTNTAPAQETAATTDRPASPEEVCAEAMQLVRDVGTSIGLELQVDVKRNRDGYVMSISGSDLGLLIGRRGQTLDALQYLVNIVANRYSDKFIRIVLDAENFRDRRRKTLEELADRLANKVVRSGREVVLEPMSSQERKVIHARLQNHNRVKTASKGEEPNRRVVIALRAGSAGNERN